MKSEEARAYWNAYVEANGGPGPVGLKLSVPYSTISAVCNGTRGVSRRLAKRMAKADPLLDASKVIWIEGKVQAKAPE